MTQDKYTPEQSRSFHFGILALIIFSAIFFVMAFTRRGYKHVDENFYYLTASFGRTDGLLVGDKVRMAGVDIGRVVDAQLSTHFNAILKMEIKDGIKIPDDSSASIISSGLMGNKYIEIEPGGSEDFLEPGSQFSYTQDAMVLEELLERIVDMGKKKNIGTAQHTAGFDEEGD